jgi:lipopolysaccharide transport system ATP-binding protein
MSGITIGDGAVIGSRSIVTKDIEAYSMSVGSPCRIKKYRFNSEVIEALLRIKWWDWDDQKVLDNAHLLGSNDLKEFIEKHG